MTVFFTSDHHFSHKNVLKLCNRHFSDIVTHDETLVEAWNSVVAPEDVVYHLGDFTLGNGNTAVSFLVRLNGKKFISCLPWHHDKRWLFSDEAMLLSPAWDVIPALYVIERKQIGNDMPIILCHYPFETWDRSHYGSLHFHGHSHGNLPHIKNRLDVGVDNAYKLLGEYRPFSLGEAIEFAQTKGE